MSTPTNPRIQAINKIIQTARLLTAPNGNHPWVIERLQEELDELDETWPKLDSQPPAPLPSPPR